MSWSNQSPICLITKLVSVAPLQFITHVLVSDKYWNQNLKRKKKKFDIWNRIRLQFWNLIRFSLNFGFTYIQCIVFLSNILLSIFFFMFMFMCIFILNSIKKQLLDRFYIFLSISILFAIVLCVKLLMTSLSYKAIALGACIVLTLNLLIRLHIVGEKSRIPPK